MRPGRLLAGALLLAASPLGAQVRGLPVAAGGVPAGVSAALDMAFPDGTLGGGTAWGTTLAFGTGRLGVAATGALVNAASAPARAAFGLRGEWMLVRSATSPFQLLALAGAGTIDLGDAGREWRVPAGASFGFRTDTPVGTLLPWLSARAQWIDLAGDAGVYAGFGGGLDVTWRGRLGLRAAYDRLLRPGGDEATFGLGLTYTFTPGF
jgi:hypothetical protein